MDIQEIQNEIFNQDNEEAFEQMRIVANEASSRCLDAYAKQGYGPHEASSAYRALAIGQPLGIDSIALR